MILNENIGDRPLQGVPVLLVGTLYRTVQYLPVATGGLFFTEMT